jgi:putative DNA primase/helicase
MSRREESYAAQKSHEVGLDPEQHLNGSGKASAAVSPNPTDLGNAERLVARHGSDLRYVHPWRKWLVYDGRRWRHDDAGEVARRGKDTVKAMYREAAEGIGRIDKDLAKHAMRSEAKERIAAMIGLAESEPGIPVRPEQLDADPWLLNVQNGTIELRTGKLRAHSRKDLLTKIAPVEYHPDAEAPRWEAALAEWLPSEALRQFVQRLIGYCLTGDVSEQVLPFLHGPGANGKTTLINAILAMTGDYGQQAAPDLLLAKHGAHPTELADLFGARLVVSVEVEDGRRLAESLVKQLTGGDKIKARRMREDFWQWDPTHKVLLVANHRPVVRGTDHAIWRRIKLVPFDVTIPKEKQDQRLPEQLRAELPGILAWAVRGCLAWQREGLGEPEEVKAATATYRSEQDALAGFIQECCFVSPHAEARATALYEAYQGWCRANGEHEENQRRFGGRLRERGFESCDITSGAFKGRKAWRGIGLRSDGPGSGRASTADDQTATTRRNAAQDAGGGADEGLPGRGTVDDRLPGESRIDKHNAAKAMDDGRPSRPESDMNGVGRFREGANPEYGLPRSTSSTQGAASSNNDIEPPSAAPAQEEAKEGKTSNTSSNPALSSSSSAFGEAEDEHVVVAAGERQPRPHGLTAEQVEEYKRLVSEGMMPEIARATVRGEDWVEF